MTLFARPPSLGTLLHRKAGRPSFDPGSCVSLAITAPTGRGPPVKTKRIKNEVTSLPAYDILKKDAAALVWVEAVADLELAKLRVRELATRTEGEYVIFDQRTL